MSHVSRRDFIRLTGAGAWGSVWLGARAVRCTQRRRWGSPRRQSPRPAKTVIQLYLAGGMTHIDTFDPKPKAPPTVRSFYKPIPTNVPGIEICELFPLLAKQADKYTLLRSITAPGGGHGGYVMLCNAMIPNECSSTHPSAKLIYPEVGAVVGLKKREDGSYQGDIPPWVCIPDIPWGGNNYGFLPPKYQAFCVGDPNNKYFRAPGVSLSPDEAKHLEKRPAPAGGHGRRGHGQAAGRRPPTDSARPLFACSPATPRRPSTCPRKKTRSASATDARCSARAASWPASWRKSASPSSRSPGAAARSKALTAGTCTSASMRTSLLCPILDRGVSALIEDLAQSGLLEHTIVILHSESSKAPEWNVDAKKLGGKHPGEVGGRKDYNLVMSALVAGGGFKPGQVVGESDEEGRYVKTRPIYPWDMWESIYQLIGIDPNDKLPNPYGCAAYVSPATACSYARAGILKEIM